MRAGKSPNNRLNKKQTMPNGIYFVLKDVIG